MLIIRLLVFGCLVAVSSCAIRAQTKTSDDLIAVLTAPETSRKARVRAATQLAEKPPTEVLPKLMEVQRKHGHEISGWGMDLFERGYRVSWQEAAAITAAYAWSGNLDNPAYSKEEKAAALLDMMRREATVAGKAEWLFSLRRCWVAAAEAEAVSILTDATADGRPSLTAATILVDKTGMKYRGEIYAAALRAPTEHRQMFASTLLSMRSPEWEGRIGRHAFTVLLEDRAAHPDRPDYGYFLASSLGKFVGTEFTPNQSDPRYKAPHGLADAFFIETVDNALRWWELNRDGFPH